MEVLSSEPDIDVDGSQHNMPEDQPQSNDTTKLEEVDVSESEELDEAMEISSESALKDTDSSSHEGTDDDEDDDNDNNDNSDNKLPQKGPGSTAIDKSEAKETRTRAIWNIWPRDPNGKILTIENSVFGKQTPNNIQLWGATMLDFYFTRRIPINPTLYPDWKGNVLTISTSSKLLGWMKKHGETCAVGELEDAELEPDPEVIEPFDIGNLIREHEELAVRHALGASLKKLPPRPALSSPRYPMPWPRPPFSSLKGWTEPPILEKLIPLSCLPKTLIVHDPWDTIDGQIKSRRNAWKSPMTGTKALRYRLQLSKPGEERAQRELDEAKEKKEAEDKITETFLADPHSRNTLPENGFLIAFDDVDLSSFGSVEILPRIFCLLPQKPTVDPDEPAHLRLSPSHQLGSGHHSVLYDAEFEVPRNLLTDHPICKSCIIDEAVRICDEEDAANPDNQWTTARASLRLTKVKKPGRETLTLNRHSGKEIRQCLELAFFALFSHYEGPIRVVRVDIGPFKPFDEPCKHFDNVPGGLRHSPTAVVRVAAKISNPGDRHLIAEAKNYEAFPVHFFEHWSGLCIPPRHQHPVPVGAIAPQYYGYYVFDGLVDDDDPIAKGPLSEKQFKARQVEEENNKKSPRYYSPILLMENCGKPIEADKLSIDDREQAISLFNRFHHAGWCHQSLYQRNIVMKPGPINVSHKERLHNSKTRDGLGEEWSFRLIDYGRSRAWNEEDHPCHDKYAKENMDRETIRLWQWMTSGNHPDQ